MKRFRLVSVAGCCVLFTFAHVGRAAILYSEDFNADHTAAWVVNNPINNPGVTDISVNFFYDYATIGVPPAPNSSGTRGLKMTANNSAGVFGGFSVSPVGESFSGNYRVSFDLWQNYVGPLGRGGSGSTQLSVFGIGTAGNVPFWAGAPLKESVTFAVTLDGGSASDFRAYSSAAPISYVAGDPVYMSSSINNNDARYSGFTPQSAPAAQLALYPAQTGSTDTGETSFKWRRVVIDVSNNVATWSIDGLPIAAVPLSSLTLGGGNILFGHSDTNASSSTDPNDSLLNVTLIDNIIVESTLVSAASRRTHGAAGTFDIGLPLSGAPAVEPRQNGAAPRMVLTYSQPPADPGCSSVTVVGGTCNGTSVSGNSLIIDMTYNANTCVRVAVGTNTVRVLAHTGNVNSDGSVNLQDLQVIKNALLVPVGTANFRLDASADGAINLQDLQAVKNNLLIPVGACP